MRTCDLQANGGFCLGLVAIAGEGEGGGVTQYLSHTQLSEESLTTASATISIVHMGSKYVPLLDWPCSPLLQMSSICRGRKTANRMGRKTSVFQAE